MVHEHDRDVIAALELAQVCEERRDLARCVLIDAVQAHEGIEHEEPRAELVHGLGERVAVALDVESQARCGDDLEVEVRELATGGTCDTGEALADDVERVLGGKQQHAAGAPDREAAQAWRTRRDRDGEVERQEGLAALWLTADDADGLIAP